MESKLLLAIEEGDNACANYFFEMNKENVIYIDSFYVWNGDLWIKSDKFAMEETISEYFTKEIKQEINTMKNLKEISKMTSSIKSISSSKGSKGIVDKCIPKFVRHMKDKKIQLDTARHMINFKNGQLNLKNGEFKSREKSDYISRALNYNYEIAEDENIKNKVELILKRICNCDETLYSFVLKWLAYCITGETNLQKFLLLLGLAGNGKSTLLEIMELVFPIYVSKLDHKTFNERYEKAYKQIIGLQNIRLAYIEELQAEKLELSLFKDMVNGNVAKVEELYKTTLQFTINFKIMITSNLMPKFKPDKGIKRRGVVCEFKNYFTSDKRQVNGSSIFEIEDVKSVFSNDKFKHCIISLLLEKTKEIYTNGFDIPDTYLSMFSDICDELDSVKQFIDNNFIITNDTNDRISKNDFVAFYNQENNTRKNFTDLLTKLKELNIQYERTYRVNGCKGCLVGIRQKTDKEIENEGTEDTKKQVEESDDEIKKQIEILQNKLLQKQNKKVEEVKPIEEEVKPIVEEVKHVIKPLVKRIKSLNGKTYQNKIKKEQAITQNLFITKPKQESKPKSPVSLDEDDEMFDGLDDLKNKCSTTLKFSDF